MKATIKLVGKMGFSWAEQEGAYICGELSARREAGPVLFGASAGGSCVDRALRCQASVHGRFGLVLRDRRHVVLACDIVGAVPLFYRVGRDEVLVSDDARLIASGAIDSDMVAEWLSTMYTLGPNTLDPEVRQVLAGECVEIDLSTGRVSRVDGWLFERTFEEHAPSLEALDESLMSSVSRSLEGWDGEVALPLSGGYDSRMLAYALKRLGYSSVICFSYGRRGNAEAKVSRAVAESLGFRWVFSEYTPERVAEHVAGLYAERAASYFQLGRVPCFQTEMAFRDLRKRGAIADDVMLLPGHAGDFAAGSHISPDLVGKAGVDVAIGHISKTHLSLSPLKWDRCGRAGEQLRGYGVSDSVALTELFDWRERQAKFIAYDPWYAADEGVRYSLPLWDREFVEFWRPLGTEHLVDRALNRRYLNEYVNPVCGLPPEADPVAGGRSSALKERLKSSPVGGLLHAARFIAARRNDPLCMRGCVPLSRALADSITRGLFPDANTLCMEALGNACIGKGTLEGLL